MVTGRLEKAKAKPTSTFLWRAPGYFDCCSTFAKSNLAQIVELAGGENIGNNMINAKQGQVSPEALAAKNPDVIIATGADWDQGKTPVKPGAYVPLGYNEAPEKAAEDLRKVVEKQPAVRETDAVKNKRTFATWHHFYDSPTISLPLKCLPRQCTRICSRMLIPQRKFANCTSSSYQLKLLAPSGLVCSNERTSTALVSAGESEEMVAHYRFSSSLVRYCACGLPPWRREHACRGSVVHADPSNGVSGDRPADCFDIRLPMTLTAVLVGGALAAAGSQMQTILGNPLAEPYTLGFQRPRDLARHSRQSLASPSLV